MRSCRQVACGAGYLGGRAQLGASFVSTGAPSIEVTESEHAIGPALKRRTRYLAPGFGVKIFAAQGQLVAGMTVFLWLR